MTIQWSTAFELGHERIDAEHRIFVRLLNEFATRVERGADTGMLARTLNEIRKFAEFHFVSEENIMEELDYPRSDEHHGVHAQLLEAFDGLMRDMASGAIRPQEVQQALVDWFTLHALQEDQKLVAHIGNIGWSNIEITNPFF
jgi:hemerythrin